MKKSILHKEMIFKDAVALLPHSLFHILSHQIILDSTLNGSKSTGWQGTSNLTLKISLVTLSIANNYNNTIGVGKAINVLMEVIYGIEGYSNKVKIDSQKSKKPNLGVLN